MSADEPTLLRVPHHFHTPEEALRTALKLNLPNLLVLAELDDGRLVYLAAPDPTLASSNWLLDRAKSFLMQPGADLGRKARA